jgi:taurine dioxygenase
VIFIRGQDLTLEQLRDFGMRFGDPHAHATYYPLHESLPEILPVVEGPGQTPPERVREQNDLARLHWNEDGYWQTTEAANWHADSTFQECPPMGAILYCRDAPDVGGDTMWANQYAAYETLSPGMMELLEGLVAIHNDVKQLRDIGEEDVRPAKVSHPVVRTHPETGRKSLFVNGYFTDHIRDVPGDESAGMLSFLLRHAVEPEFCCRFRWQTGSLAIWDNRCTLHRVIADFGLSRRELYRFTIGGDRPY